MAAVNLLQGLCHHGQGDEGEAADGETVGDLLEEEDLGDHGDDDGGGPGTRVTCHVTCYVTWQQTCPPAPRPPPSPA